MEFEYSSILLPYTRQHVSTSVCYFKRCSWNSITVRINFFDPYCVIGTVSAAPILPVISNNGQYIRIVIYFKLYIFHLFIARRGGYLVQNICLSCI